MKHNFSPGAKGEQEEEASMVAREPRDNSYMNLPGKRLTLPEQIALSTVRIECIDRKSKKHVGTGFFFDCSNDPKTALPVIVTAWHLIEEKVSFKFYLNRLSPEGDVLFGRRLLVEYEGCSGWVRHPVRDVDLCALPFGKAVNDMWAGGRPPAWRMFKKEMIPSEQEMANLYAMEEIVMVGYPIGFWDSVNSMPIFRRGITASHPRLDFEGRKEFIVDLACFPGSSGSPVLLYRPGLKIKGDQWIKIQGGGPYMRLAGILYAGPEVSVDGKILVVNVPTAHDLTARSRIPVHLGCVIKAQRLLDFGPIFVEQAERKVGREQGSEE